MGRSRQYNSSHNNFDSSASGHAKPKHRYRVMMRRVARPPQAAWMTNDVEYARSIADRLNYIVSTNVAWVEEWNTSMTRGRWTRVQEAIELNETPSFQRT